MKLSVASIVAVAVCTAAHGQTLISRSSTLNHNYVYGAGADTWTGGDSRSFTMTELMGHDNMDFGGNTGGTLPNGEPYNAGVNMHAHYHYDVAGTPMEIQAIHLDALVHAHSMVSGAGVAAMHVSNPGDEVILAFRVNSTIEFHLNGSVDSPVPVPQSFVALQRFNGIIWEYVFNSQFNPEGRGPFDMHGMLAPGTYRMWSQLSVDVQGEQPPLDVHCMYHLELPGLGGCTADFNQDGVVDFFDYLDFVDAFASNLPQADFNQDGVIDFFDYLDFVDQFSVGCS